jgi:hypothetical protein
LGKPFWRRESFDHWARNDFEFRRITRYIEYKPVNAGLLSKPEQYTWLRASVKQ